MIISRTPFRISFFGGGTDYPGWYRDHGGAVLATTINKYCYITCRYLPPFFKHKYRVVWSKIERCETIDEISHPVVRELLGHLNIDEGIEVHHDGDLPARSGMGSSSAFTVGLLNALYALKGRMPTKQELARESIHIEQDLLLETVGSQDQVLAAHGGFNHVSFQSNDEITVRPITLPPDRLRELDSHLMLFYTGIERTASEIADSYVQDIQSRARPLRVMQNMVDEALALLGNGGDLRGFGVLLDEAWQLKRSLSHRVTSSRIDEIYADAKSVGAIGGKITGAGGGGFFLLFVPPEDQARVREKLGDLLHVPFQFESKGSEIIFFDAEEEYLRESWSATGTTLPEEQVPTQSIK